jgi:predicted metal-dependent hydrolase
VHSIELNGQKIDYTLRFSAKAKRRRIRVSSKGVEVVLPLRADAKQAESLLRDHSDWLMRQTQRMAEMGQLRDAQNEQTKSTLLLRGQPMQLHITTEATARVYGRVEHNGDKLIVYLPTGSDIDAQLVLESWLRRQARHDLLKQITERSAQMSLIPNRIYLMNQRTRWGSCSSKRNLSFNWRLVLAPPEILDYIVVHELAHLKEMNHSQRFWLLVRSFCPDFERHKRWLKENEWRLTVAA